ncbi:MAG: Phycocyanin alpha phycocyanobilin lyase [Planctomycetaceae bacterium]|nr:Phycocyanin alpha phycocyanobilin lyase [Planctomycetaceae bacterium]
MTKRVVAWIAFVMLAYCLPVAAEQPQAAVAGKLKTAADLLKEFSSVKYSWEQTDVAEKMIALGDKSVIPQLESYFNSENRKERCNAGYVVSGLGDWRGSLVILRELKDREPRFTNILRSDGKPYPAGQINEDRYLAVCLLGRLKEKDAVPDLIEATRDKTIHYAAAVSLGQISDRKAIPALQQMARDFPDHRLWAGYGLALLSEPEGFEILTEMASDPQWVNRRHSVEAMGTIGDRKMAPLLVKALKDQKMEVRISAAISLGKIGDPATLPVLTAALNESEAESAATKKIETDFADQDGIKRREIFNRVARNAIELIQVKSK